MWSEKIEHLSAKDKKYFDALIEAREKFSMQFMFHKNEALMFDKSSAWEKSGLSTHMADCATDNFRHDMELEMLTHEGDTIEQIDEAIERLINGEYGSCFDCGADINPERLEIKPHAIMCIKCKSIREDNNGLRPDLYDYDELGNEIERMSF